MDVEMFHNELIWYLHGLLEKRHLVY